MWGYYVHQTGDKGRSYTLANLQSEGSCDKYMNRGIRFSRATCIHRQPTWRSSYRPVMSGLTQVEGLGWEGTLETLMTNEFVDRRERINSQIYGFDILKVSQTVQTASR
jgi:hypothetical protein